MRILSAFFIVLILINPLDALYMGNALHTPIYIDKIIVVTNDIDYGYCWPYIYWGAYNFRVNISRVKPCDFEDYKNSSFILILGGPKAYDGVGDIVAGILSEDEIKSLSVKGAKEIFVLHDVWSSGQIVVVAAGNTRYETKMLAMDDNDNTLPDMLEPLMDSDSDGIPLNLDPHPEFCDLEGTEEARKVNEFISYSLQAVGYDSTFQNLNWFLSWDFKHYFLNSLNDEDEAGAAFYILCLLHSSNVHFDKYYKLAVAISLTWDNPKEETSYVSDKYLVDLYQFFVDISMSGETYYDLRHSSLQDLEYIVSVFFLDPGIEIEYKSVGGYGPPVSELWRLHNMYYGYADDVYSFLTDVYTSIPYNLDHLSVAVDMTPSKIEMEGGACVVQAYYTRCVASSLGIPTKYVAVWWDRNNGDSGGHAFISFQDQDGNWLYGVASIVFPRPIKRNEMTSEYLNSHGFKRINIQELSVQSFKYATILNWNSD